MHFSFPPILFLPGIKWKLCVFLKIASLVKGSKCDLHRHTISFIVNGKSYLRVGNIIFFSRIAFIVFISMIEAILPLSSLRYTIWEFV